VTRRSRRAALLVVALTTASCGYSTSTALLPTHLKTIAVPVFENGTTQSQLEQEITQAVIDRFVQDNHLKVVGERTANAVVRGRVTEYRNAVFGFSAAEQASEYRVTIGVSVTVKDLVKNREMWKDESLQKTTNYFVVDVGGQKARTELDGRKEAVQKIADEILARTVEGW
jgi:outer membrane lipopolysaccharide assembly protein LptE/RlpB